MPQAGIFQSAPPTSHPLLQAREEMEADYDFDDEDDNSDLPAKSSSQPRGWFSPENQTPDLPPDRDTGLGFPDSIDLKKKQLQERRASHESASTSAVQATSAGESYASVDKEVSSRSSPPSRSIPGDAQELRNLSSQRHADFLSVWVSEEDSIFPKIWLQLSWQQCFFQMS